MFLSSKTQRDYERVVFLDASISLNNVRMADKGDSCRYAASDLNDLGARVDGGSSISRENS